MRGSAGALGGGGKEMWKEEAKKTAKKGPHSCACLAISCVPPASRCPPSLPTLPASLPLPERDALLGEGFSNWMRRDFNAFVRACEKYGRASLADIARDIETKSEEEVRGRVCVCAGVGYGWGCGKAQLGVGRGMEQRRAARCCCPLTRPVTPRTHTHDAFPSRPLRRCARMPRCFGSGTPRSTTTRRWVGSC